VGRRRHYGRVTGYDWSRGRHDVRFDVFCLE
jgi:hypothetical protein